jgi:hypothetical protein
MWNVRIQSRIRGFERFSGRLKNFYSDFEYFVLVVEYFLDTNQQILREIF